MMDVHIILSHVMVLIGCFLFTMVEIKVMQLIDRIFFAPRKRKRLKNGKGWKSAQAEEISKYAEPDDGGHYSLWYR